MCIINVKLGVCHNLDFLQRSQRKDKVYKVQISANKYFAIFAETFRTLREVLFQCFDTAPCNKMGEIEKSGCQPDTL